MKVKAVRKHGDIINPGKCRIIRINGEAIYEILRENMFEHGADYFNLLPSSDYILSMQMDDSKSFFICVAYNRKEFQPIDFDRIHKEIEVTATTLFSGKKKYIDADLSSVLIKPSGEKD